MRSGSRAWALDGQPLLGISVFAVLGISLEDLLRRRFASFRAIYLPTAGRLAGLGFESLATEQRPHFTVRLRRPLLIRERRLSPDEGSRRGRGGHRVPPGSR